MDKMEGVIQGGIDPSKYPVPIETYVHPSLFAQFANSFAVSM
jgi:hypothetical protein